MTNLDRTSFCRPAVCQSCPRYEKKKCYGCVSSRKAWPRMAHIWRFMSCDVCLAGCKLSPSIKVGEKICNYSRSITQGYVDKTKNSRFCDWNLFFKFTKKCAVPHLHGTYWPVQRARGWGEFITRQKHRKHVFRLLELVQARCLKITWWGRKLNYINGKNLAWGDVVTQLCTGGAIHTRHADVTYWRQAKVVSCTLSLCQLQRVKGHHEFSGCFLLNFPLGRCKKSHCLAKERFGARFVTL